MKRSNLSLSYKLAQLLATLFGVGYFPGAPGTYASILTVLAVWFVPKDISLLLMLICLGMGIFATKRYLKDNPKKLDPSEVVIDEVVGQWLTLLVIPHEILWFLIAFLLFRFFDILKPFPVSWADNVGKKKGESLNQKTLSLLLDDVVAGGMAASIVLFISFLKSF